jgi:hypothetical protein
LQLIKPFDYDLLSIIFYWLRGGVAQLGERLLRMQEGGGSNPLTSKNRAAISNEQHILLQHTTLSIAIHAVFYYNKVVQSVTLQYFNPYFLAVLARKSMNQERSLAALGTKKGFK